MLSDLTQDSVELDKIVEKVSKGVEMHKIIIENSYESLTNKYSIEEIGEIISGINSVGLSFFPRHVAYNQITNSGYLPLIRSDNIKNKLVELYDRTYTLYNQVDSVVEQKTQFEAHPIIRGKLYLFDPRSNLQLPAQFDDVKLKMHYDELASLCRNNFGISTAALNILKRIQKEISQLINLIREEIE